MAARNPFLRLSGSHAESRSQPGTQAARAPSMPGWLSREARAEWRRVVPHLLITGAISETDRAVLAAYCETWAEYQAAVKAVRKNGATCRTAKGHLAKSPAVTLRNEARSALARYAAELGLSPASRSTIRARSDDHASLDAA